MSISYVIRRLLETQRFIDLDDIILTMALVGAGALFAWKASKTLIRFGWI